MYREFQGQFIRNGRKGWHETGLPWKGNHPPLDNKAGSLRRLTSQVAKPRRIGKLEKYDAIISDQIAEDVVQPAPKEVSRTEY